MSELQIGFLICFIAPQILFFVVLWGSGFVYMCHNYLQDGESTMWTLGDWLDKDSEETYGEIGIFGMGVLATISLGTAMLTKSTGDIIPIISLSLAGLFGIMYTLRAVIRLNKKLDKHSSDKEAHK